MRNYFIFIAGFAVAAVLAVIPATMLLERLGFKRVWGVVIFLLLTGAPFLPAMVVATFPAVMLDSSNIAMVAVGLKIVEWAPVLILLWYFALMASGGGRKKARAAK